MRKQFLSACLIATSGLLVATSANAAGTNIQRGAYIGGQASYSWFENDFDYQHDHQDWYGGQLGYRFTPRFSVEASYLEGKADLRYSEGEVLNRQPLISARYHFADTGILGFEPYMGLAAGEFWTKNNDPAASQSGKRHRETVLGPEIGVQRRFLSRLLLDVGARGPYSLDEDRWEGQVYAGLNFLFSVKDRQEKVVEEPVEEYVPEPVPEPQVITRSVNESGTAAQFGFDQDSLSSDQLDDLQAAARFLNDNPNTSVTLEGHTCNMGPEEYNLQLSERRANTAKSFLEEQGVSSNRITVVGKGSSEPIADNSTAEGRERNRRVDAIITGTVEEVR